MSSSLDIIALVYKSKDYLKSIKFEIEQTLKNTKVNNWEINGIIIGNDPTTEIKDILTNPYFPEYVDTDIYEDHTPHDYYLNRIYRAWNYGVFRSHCDYVCLVNSDMIFSDNWLSNLINGFEREYRLCIPCSRLVESGKMPSGKWGVSKNFGRHPNNIDYNGFNQFAKSISINQNSNGGLYMPCIFERDRFIRNCGYPQGNILNSNGNIVKSGDAYFFENYKLKHVTVMDSIVYHIQEGEMDDKV